MCVCASGHLPCGGDRAKGKGREREGKGGGENRLGMITTEY